MKFNKLITPRSRGTYGVSCMLASLLVLFGYLFYTQGYVNTAFAMFFLAAAFNFAAGLYFSRIHPEEGELLSEIERLRAVERLTEIAWLGIRFLRLSYRDMNRKQKAGQIVCYAFAAIMLAFGIGDLLGVNPPQPLEMSDGKMIYAPQWLTGFMLIGFSYIAWTVALILRVQIVQKSEENAKRDFSDLDGSGKKH